MQTLEPSVFSDHRTQYTPDGAFDHGLMALASIPCFAVAAFVAAGLSFLFYSGFYFIVMIPLLASLACGGFVSQVVTKTHCRNPLMAGLLGAVVSLTAYVGSYHACLLWEVGVENIHRVDMLPTYLSLRWETDTVEDARDLHGTNEQNRAKVSPARYWGNMGLFALEACIMAGIGFAIPRLAAQRPYCSKHRCWLGEAKGSVHHDGVSSPVRISVQNQLANREANEFSIHHCTSAMAGHDQCEIYLSAVKVLNTGSQTKKEKVIENVQLNPDEIAEFASLLPVDRLASLQQPVNDLSGGVQPNYAGHVEEPSYAVNNHSNSTQFATVTKVESPHGGRFNSPFHRNIRNAIAYSPVLGLVGGLGAMCGPYALHNIGWDVNPTGWWTLFGFLLLPLTAYLCVVISTVPYNSMRKMAEAFFPQRAQAIVDFSNSNSRFAITIPRHEVAKNSFGEWDFGFVEADARRNEIRFEGDIERYRIPVASISALDIQQVVFCSSQNSTSYEYLVRLVFQTEHGPVERTFSQRHLWRASSKDEARRHPAQDLYAYLQSAMGATPGIPDLDLQLAAR